jgi:hypothetical protein
MKKNFLKGIFCLLVVPLSNLSFAVDTQRPVISSFSFSPTMVDVTSEDALVTLTAHVTDNLGVTEGSSYRVSLGNSASDTWIRGDFVLVSGTAQEGIWEATVPISMDVGAGDWGVTMTGGFKDAAGNYAVRSPDGSSILTVIDNDTLYTDDSDSDGMPDVWEARYGLDPNDASDAASDQDNDGVSAYDEFMAGTIPVGILDIDGNGQYDALTDGLLLLRGMFGLTEDALISGAVDSGAVYTSSGEISARIDILGDLVDIDGNGEADALTDGLLIFRYLFGLREGTLVNGVIASDAAVTSSDEVGAKIESLMPAL